MSRPHTVLELETVDGEKAKVTSTEQPTAKLLYLLAECLTAQAKAFYSEEKGKGK